MLTYLKILLRRRRLNLKWRLLNAHNSTRLDLIPETCDFFSQVSVGKYTYGPVWAAWSGNPEEKLSIGSYCSIGSGVKFILGSEHPYKALTTFPFKVKVFDQPWEATTKGPIKVKDDVWIGEDALVLSGVTIGQGAVVAARSVVVKDVPSYAIVGGNPARVIRHRFASEVIEKLERVNLDDLDQIGADSLNFLYQELNSDNVDEIIERLGIIKKDV